MTTNPLPPPNGILLPIYDTNTKQHLWWSTTQKNYQQILKTLQDNNLDPNHITITLDNGNITIKPKTPQENTFPDSPLHQQPQTPSNPTK